MALSDNSVCFAPVNMIKEKRSFDFFALPRELRDFAYEYMCRLSAEKDIGLHHHLRLIVRNLPAKGLLVVNHQFKEELEKIAAKAVSLVAMDRNSDDTAPLNLPHRLLKIPNIEIHLAIACFSEDHEDEDCNSRSEFELHKNALMSILPKFLCLHAVSLNFHVVPHQYAKECEKEVIKHLRELPPDLLSVCPQTTINIFHQHFSNDNDSGDDEEWDLSKAMTLIVTNHNEARQLCRVSTGDERESNVTET